jgi:hypothetical protein
MENVGFTCEKIASWRPLDLGAEFSQYFPRYSPKEGHELPVHPSVLRVPTRTAQEKPKVLTQSLPRIHEDAEA